MKLRFAAKAKDSSRAGTLSSTRQACLPAHRPLLRSAPRAAAGLDAVVLGVADRLAAECAAAAAKWDRLQKLLKFRQNTAPWGSRLG
jgi:hypothetical protein